jgi:hypothetical protein
MAVELIHGPAIVRITFSGAITAGDLAVVARESMVLEADLPRSRDRLVDLGASSTLSVSFSDVATLASLRREFSPHNPIRTAIVVHNAAQRGYARMFQTVNDHPLVAVRIFDSCDQAERWLAGPADRAPADG